MPLRHWTLRRHYAIDYYWAPLLSQPPLRWLLCIAIITLRWAAIIAITPFRHYFFAWLRRRHWFRRRRHIRQRRHFISFRRRHYDAMLSMVSDSATFLSRHAAIFIDIISHAIDIIDYATFTPYAITDDSLLLIAITPLLPHLAIADYASTDTPLRLLMPLPITPLISIDASLAITPLIATLADAIFIAIITLSLMIIAIASLRRHFIIFTILPHELLLRFHIIAGFHYAIILIITWCFHYWYFHYYWLEAAITPLLRHYIRLPFSRLRH